MQNSQNPLTKADQIATLNAIKNSDVDYIHQKIVNRDLTNIHLDLSDIPDVPSVLKFYPPIISIAAYYSTNFACNSRSPEFLFTVQDIGCDFNIPDNAKRTCMHYACQFSNEFAAKWLWGQGLPIDNIDKLGYSPLMFACQSGNVEIINFLIENGSDKKRIFQNSKTRRSYQNPTRTMFHFACESGNVEAVKLFETVDINFLSWDGTPLNISVIKNSVSVTKYLIENGANPNIGSEFKDFPILNAARNGNLEIMQILVDAGANININGADNASAIKICFEKNATDCILYLTSKNVNVKNLNCPPLLYAAKNKNCELLLNLIKVNKNAILQTDSDGNNIYHFLGMYEAIDVMNSLLPNKPQDAPNKVGITPLGFAAQSGKEESVKYFIQNGANPNHRDAKDFKKKIFF